MKELYTKIEEKLQDSEELNELVRALMNESNKITKGNVKLIYDYVVNNIDELQFIGRTTNSWFMDDYEVRTRIEVYEDIIDYISTIQPDWIGDDIVEQYWVVGENTDILDYVGERYISTKRLLEKDTTSNKVKDTLKGLNMAFDEIINKFDRVSGGKDYLTTPSLYVESGRVQGYYWCEYDSEWGVYYYSGDNPKCWGDGEFYYEEHEFDLIDERMIKRDTDE